MPCARQWLVRDLARRACEREQRLAERGDGLLEADQREVFARRRLDPRIEVLSGREALVAAMLQLPDRLKLVLQLFFVEELNLTEIAAVLEVSVPRVHQLRAKALKDLRKLMDAPGAD